MAKIYLDTTNNLFFVGGEKAEGCITPAPGSVLDVICMPLSASETYLPIYTKIYMREKPVILNPMLYSIDYGKGVYEIRSTPQAPVYAQTFDMTFQQSYQKNGIEHTVTVYRDQSTKIYVENDRFFYRTDAGTLENVDVRFDYDAMVPLFIITGSTGTQQYLLILTFDSDYRELLSVQADEIRYEAEEIVTVDHLRDMQRHRIETHYRFENDAYQVCERVVDAKPVFLPAPLIPYQFLEAVSSGDNQTLRALLPDDLQSDAETYRDFFGGEIRFAEPCFFDTSDSVYLLSNDAGTIKAMPYFFKVEDGIIKDIRPLF